MSSKLRSGYEVSHGIEAQGLCLLSDVLSQEQAESYSREIVC